MDTASDGRPGGIPLGQRRRARRSIPAGTDSKTGSFARRLGSGLPSIRIASPFPLLAVDVQDIRQVGRQGCPIDVRLKRRMKGLHGGAGKTHENSCYDQSRQEPANFQQ